MTEGSIAKNIILFYIPLAIGGLFQQLYSFVDSVVVGRGIGAQALAAVGATSIVVWLTLGFAMGLTRGFCIHISQAYGKKDYHLVNRGFFVASVLSLIVGAMISIVGSLAIRDFLILMHTPGEILEQSLDYIKVILLGFVITVLNNLFMSVLQFGGFVYAILCAACFLYNKCWSGLRICTHTEVGRAGSGCGNGVVSGVLLCDLCRRFEKIEICQYFGRQ